MKLSANIAACLLASISGCIAFTPASLSVPRSSRLFVEPATKPIIIGAGVGGLSAALALKAAGLEPVVLEQRSSERLFGGAGINCQALAIDAMNTLGVSTSTLEEAGQVIKKQSYYTTDGRHVCTLNKKGHGSTPGQIGLHRGRLVKVLLDECRARDIEVLMNHHVSTIDLDSSPDTIIVKSSIVANRIPSVIEGTMLVGADGLNSNIRKHYVTGNKNKDPQTYHGTTHYRGVCESFPTFLDGRTMVLSGGLEGVKAVVYPIGPDRKGLQTINWVLAVKEDEINEDRKTHADHIVKLLQANKVHLDFLDLESLITSTPQIQAWPMVDLDPLDTWTDDRIALLGDAAHGMLPVGSGGAMAALFDSLALKDAVEKSGDSPTRTILRTYEQMRYKEASLHQGSCRVQPAETIVQEVMDKFPLSTDEVPAEYEEKIRAIMSAVHNPKAFDPQEGVISADESDDDY